MHMSVLSEKDIVQSPRAAHRRKSCPPSPPSRPCPWPGAGVAVGGLMGYPREARQPSPPLAVWPRQPPRRRKKRPAAWQRRRRRPWLSFLLDHWSQSQSLRGLQQPHRQRCLPYCRAERDWLNQPCGVSDDALQAAQASFESWLCWMLLGAWKAFSTPLLCSLGSR